MLSIQSDQELRQIIGLYGPAFQPDRWPPVCVSSGFSGAVITRFSARDHQYALRIWPINERSATKLEALAGLLEYLHHHGITYVAVPIKKQNGSIATISQSGSLMHIEPWLPGSADHSPPYSSIKQNNAVQALARMHAIAANHVPKLEHHAWIRPITSGKSPGLVHRQQKLNQYLKNGILSEVQKSCLSQRSASFYQRLQACFRSQSASIWEKLQLATNQILPLQPVFRDVWRDHILFTGDKVTGLIDPAAFGNDSVVTDITRLLGSIAGNNPKAWQAALASYQEIRPLSQTEQNLIPIFDQSKLFLSAIGCFERFLMVSASPAHYPDDISIRLGDRLEEYLSRLESYSSFNLLGK